MIISDSALRGFGDARAGSIAIRPGYDWDTTGETQVRYVIVIAAVAFFIIWDGLYNHGAYLDHFVRFLIGVMRSIGLL